MSDATIVKIIEIVVLSIILTITAIFMHDEPQIWGSILGLLSLVIGGGTVIKNALRGIINDK
jgi:hypothetical protein